MSVRIVTEFRPIDPVIETRLSEIQRATARADSAIELVVRFLSDNNDEYVAGMSVAVLADALALAQRELHDVADRLDLVHLRNMTESPVVRSQEVA